MSRRFRISVEIDRWSGFPFEHRDAALKAIDVPEYDPVDRREQVYFEVMVCSDGSFGCYAHYATSGGEGGWPFEIASWGDPLKLQT